MTESRAFASPEIAKPVVVALVPVAEVKENVVRVEDAGAKKPLSRARVVEVANSFVESLVNGKEKEAVEHPVQLVTVRLPILATLALKFVVEARPET